MSLARVLVAGLCLVGLSVAPALAQGPTGGLEAGVSFSQISPAAVGESVRLSPGLLAGVYAVLPLRKLVSIQPEVVYAQKHSHLTMTSGSTVQTTNLKLDYLEIPILVKLPLFHSIYILEGAAFGWPVRAKLEPASGAEQDIKSQTTSPDIGLVIGGGVALQQFAIEGRFDEGLRTINSTAGSPVQRNRSFSILARRRL